MKIQKLIAITTDNYAEEQYILTRFPGAWWYHRGDVGKNTFYVPQNREKEVKEALKEWKEKNNE